MKRILATVALGALLIGSTSMVAQAHGVHGPVVHPGRGGFGHPGHPGGGRPGWGHGPGRWHGGIHAWGPGWDRFHYHGAWFWFGSSVLWWDVASGAYLTVVPVWDPATDSYYFIRGGARVYLVL